MAPDAYFKDMWWKITEGVKRRGKVREKLFTEARELLKEYTERRDDQLIEYEFGMDRYRKKLRELREENRELKSDIEKNEMENDKLRGELEEMRSISGFLNPKENESPATIQNP